MGADNGRDTYTNTLPRLQAVCDLETKGAIMTINIDATCPACGVGITTGNAGGYRTYCEGCVDKVTALIQAQTAVIAMLKECGLSAVLISADGNHNR